MGSALWQRRYRSDVLREGERVSAATMAVRAKRIPAQLALAGVAPVSASQTNGERRTLYCTVAMLNTEANSTTSLDVLVSYGSCDRLQVASLVFTGMGFRAA